MLGFAPIAGLPISGQQISTTVNFGWHVPFPSHAIKTKTVGRSANEISFVYPQVDAPVVVVKGWLPVQEPAKKPVPPIGAITDQFAFPYQTPAVVISAPTIAWLTQFADPIKSKIRTSDQPTFVSPQVPVTLGWLSQFDGPQPTKIKPADLGYSAPYGQGLTVVASPSLSWFQPFEALQLKKKQALQDQNTFVSPVLPTFLGWFNQFEQINRRPAPFKQEQIAFVPTVKTDTLGWLSQFDQRNPNKSTQRLADALALAPLAPANPSFGWYAPFVTTIARQSPARFDGGIASPVQPFGPPEFGWFLQFNSPARISPINPWSWTVTPDFVAHPETSPPGGTSKQDKTTAILLDRKRRRIDSEAKAAKLAQMEQDRLAALLARYSDDEFIPFPLFDVLAQQQAADDDLIMALLLSA